MNLPSMTSLSKALINVSPFLITATRRLSGPNTPGTVTFKAGGLGFGGFGGGGGGPLGRVSGLGGGGGGGGGGLGGGAAE